MSAHPATDIFIVGAGGIGCAVGYALRAGDLDVTFVDVDQEKLEWHPALQPNGQLLIPDTEHARGAGQQ